MKQDSFDMPIHCEVAGIILVGGRSSRMGRDKALLPLPGNEHTTFVAHLASLLTRQCHEVVLVGRNWEQVEQYNNVGIPSLIDEKPDIGPLMGLYTGLCAVHSPAALVTAVDMPHVSPSLLSFLLAQPQLDEFIYVPMVNGIPQVLFATYPRSILPLIEMRLQEGRRDPRSLLEFAKVRYIEEAQLRGIDPQLRSFLNVNTPEDYSPLFASI